jgi:hypothetical protein
MVKCLVCGCNINPKYNVGKCFSCYMKQLRGKKGIKDIMSRLGENSVSGKKNWVDKIKQENAIKKNYRVEK